MIKLQCALYQLFRLNELYKHTKSFFFNFKFAFEILTENQKIFKQIARRQYWSNCNVLYINGLYSMSSSNWWKVFFFLISFFFFVVIFNRILALCLCKRGGRGIMLNSRRSSFCVIYSLCDIFYVIYSYRQDIKNETRRALRTDEKLFFF